MCKNVYYFDKVMQLLIYLYSNLLFQEYWLYGAIWIRNKLFLIQTFFGKTYTNDISLNG